MPVTVDIAETEVPPSNIEKVFDYFTYIDATFSTYKETSEISQINAGILTPEQWSSDMMEVMQACEMTKAETNGYFDIARNGLLDPSGYVKGWAIQNVANLIASMGYRNYYVDAGGDMQTAGFSPTAKPWIVGIRSPFNQTEIVKRVNLLNKGMATSGTYVRGQHIYNPLLPTKSLTDILSLTVISDKIVDADRFATAAFAMGKEGITFIATLEGYEAYQIDAQGIATFTEGFTHYL